MPYLSTEQIAQSGEYFGTSEDFFGKFLEAFNASSAQVLKLETRQHYVERDSASWCAWMERDNWAEAMEKLDGARSVDLPLYEDLQRRGIDFVRCRPVLFPLSKYMEWEFKVFEFNEKHGERVYCANLKSMPGFFENVALHDFMVFDTRLAAVHEYNDSGENTGGWWVRDSESILELVKIHGAIKANCRPFRVFKAANEARLEHL